jgi:PAS domain S-box-containing protein
MPSREASQDEVTEHAQSVEVLARIAREWQKTFDATLDAIWLLDREHHIVRSNRTAQQIFGVPCSAMIGKHCWEIVHGTTQPISECPMLRAKKSLCREDMPLQIGQRWFAVYIDPILDENGNYSGAVHIVTDITERKHTEEMLRESEERFSRLAQASFEGIVIHDNPATAAFFMSICLPSLQPHTQVKLGRPTTKAVARPSSSMTKR